MTRTALLPVLLAAALALPAARAGLAGVAADPVQDPARVPEIDEDSRRMLAELRTPELDRELFFAILEGLYRDGVANDVVESMLREDAAGQLVHFVWQCPICMPTLDALRVYRARAGFAGRKVHVDTFGRGLGDELRARLLAGDLETRDEAIQEVTRRWIAEHMDHRRLTPEERDAWQQEMAARRKLGMLYLAADRPLRECALCDGANDAFDPRWR